MQQNFLDRIIELFAEFSCLSHSACRRIRTSVDLKGPTLLQRVVVDQLDYARLNGTAFLSYSRFNGTVLRSPQSGLRESNPVTPLFRRLL